MEFVRAIANVNRHDVALAGGKAANLGELVQAKLPVPPGFVLLTSAYREFVEANALSEEIERLAQQTSFQSSKQLEESSCVIRSLFERSAMPDEIAQAILGAYRELGANAVAVRSSATAEDLPAASFAGQQETYLNVRGEEALLEAVKRSWASLWTARALAYRSAVNQDLRKLTANRRLAYDYWFTVVPPDVIGPDGKPVIEEEECVRVLEGIAASGGQVRGKARIVLDPREAATLRAGEILVTQATDPGWTPVFPLVSGLVLEIGGQISHGAILAREYGIPAVVNVIGATRHIRDGRIIIVDGTNGRVLLGEDTTSPFERSHCTTLK